MQKKTSSRSLRNTGFGGSTPLCNTFHLSAKEAKYNGWRLCCLATRRGIVFRCDHSQMTTHFYFIWFKATNVCFSSSLGQGTCLFLTACAMHSCDLDVWRVQICCIINETLLSWCQLCRWQVQSVFWSTKRSKLKAGLLYTCNPGPSTTSHSHQRLVSY